MTVIARDLFLGDADVDIDGRTPDGGEEPSTAVGVWVRGTDEPDTIDIVPGHGAQATSGSSAEAELTGLTLATDYAVRITFDFGGAGLNSTVSVLAHSDTVAGENYITAITYQTLLGTPTYVLSLYYNDGGFSETPLTPLTPGPHTLEVSSSNGQISASVDGVGQLTYELDATVGEVPLTGGSPAFNISNRVGERLISVTRFEVDTAAVDADGREVDIPLSPCAQAYDSAVYAREHWSGADESNIGGRIPDGGGSECLQQGIWYNVPMRLNSAPLQHSATSGEELIQIQGAGEPWNHEALEGIPDLSDDYTVEKEAYFTAVGAPPYGWFSCLARQQRSEAETISFTAASTSWVCPASITSVLVRLWQGGARGGTAQGNPSAAGGAAGGTYVEKQVAVTPGETYTVVVGQAQASSLVAGQATRFQLAGVDLALATGSSAQAGAFATVDSTNGAGGVGNTTGSIGDIIVAGSNGEAGNFTTGVIAGAGGQGGNGGGAGGLGRPDNTAGQAGTAPGGGGSGGKANNATDRAGGNGARGQAQIVYSAGGDHATESGYELLWDNLGNFILERYLRGTYTHVVELVRPVEADRTYRVKLCVKGSQLCCSLDDVPLIYYTDTMFPTGAPGFCHMDASNTGAIVKGVRWRISSDEANAPLCGGDGSGHGEPAPGEEVAPIIWPKKVGAWRPVEAPLDVASDLLARYGKGAPRRTLKPWIMKNGAWREIVGTSSDPSDGGLWNGDPGDAIPDPGCGQIPVVDVPSEPLLPLEDKLFFCYNLPIEGATDPFDTAVWAMGEWMPGYLAICQARGLRMIGGVGGYSRFFTGGVYDPAKMDAVIEGHAGFMDTIANYADLGIFYGQLVIDDYHSAERWGTVISLEEVNRIAGVWKSNYPWIRTVLRDTPTNVAGYGSNTLSNVDTFLAQYVTRYGDVTDWMNNQIAQAQGHFGGAAILWSLNFKHPSGMTSPPMTAAQVLEYGTPLAEQSYSHGLGGWMYDLEFLRGAGVVNALGQLRNIMAGVP